MNWAGIVTAIISYAGLAISVLTSFREGFLFRSGEYDVHTEGSSVFESEEEKKKREEAAQLEGLAVGEQSEIISNAQSYIQKINSYVPFLGTAIDFIFSPNIALLLGIIGIALSFFTPLGPIVGGISVGLGVTFLAFTLTIGVIGEKERQISKQITTVVKELEKDLNGIAKIQERITEVGKANGVKDIDLNKVFSGMYSYQGHLGSLKGIAQPTEAYNSWTAPIAGIIIRFPMGAFGLATGIATLNPIVIGMGVGMLVLGETSAIRSSQRGAKVAAAHAENMADIRSKIGLPELTGEDGLNTYAALLSQAKRARMAMERFESDYGGIIDSMQSKGITPTNDNLRAVFQNEYLAKQPVVSMPPHIPGVLECLMSIIYNGVTWSKMLTVNSPLIPEFQGLYNDNAYKHIAITERVREQQPTLTVDKLKVEVTKEIQTDKSVEEKMGVGKVDIDVAVSRLIQKPDQKEEKSPTHWRDQHKQREVGGSWTDKTARPQDGTTRALK